ncbi:MAG: hydroxymethylglutaryl-CoA lyase [Alphaproteobacteria bacterium]|nr:hydroxymethylglutaryl-CoA lyase [Alphaproteobacteria bacterium]
MAEKVVINEVGLRDGLQIQPKLVTTEGKLELCQALIDSGVRSFEATSFVHPKAVPQMADADALFPRLPKTGGVAYSALVLNDKGYERAMAAGVKSVAIALASTETMNQKNIRMSLDQATTTFAGLMTRAKREGIEARAYISTAMACPYEGKVPVKVVMDLADKMVKAGADKLAIADTIGASSPAQCEEVFRAVVKEWGAARIAAHFHDTRAMGLTLAWVALQEGVREFDSSIGGLGGCPFAPGASGNLATEDLVFMLNDSGFDTGVDVAKLRRAVGVAERLTGQRLGGRITAWWLSQERKAAAKAAQAAE